MRSETACPEDEHCLQLAQRCVDSPGEPARTVDPELALGVLGSRHDGPGLRDDSSASWLAAPHAIHHRWLDDRLAIHPELRSANFFGHICLEYATQVAFSAVLAAWLPLTVVAVAAVIQTLIFVYVASQQGLDVNHRPVDLLDAYQPSWLALPAYHALHHVYPNAHFSAYSKLIDHLAGTGTWIQGRQFWLLEADSPFGRELRSRLEDGGAVITIPRSPAAVYDRLAEGGDPCDVLALCAPTGGREPGAEGLVEALVTATRTHQLPPEVWIVQRSVHDVLGRTLHDDPRVACRVIVVGDTTRENPIAGPAAARRAFARIRRGSNFVSGSPAATALREFLRFRRGVRRPHAPNRRRQRRRDSPPGASVSP